MPLEDMNSTHALPGFDLHHKLWHTFPLLTDSPDYANEDASHFMLAWNAFPHPAFYARFYSGNYHKDAFQPIQKAFTRANGTSFKALHWYQVVLTWNHDAQDYVMYVNGFKAADMNRFREPGVPSELYHEAPGDKLFTGSPTYAVSGLSFYDRCFNASEVAALYKTEQQVPQEVEDARLGKFYLGLDLPLFDWKPDSAWVTQLALSLKDPAHLSQFYIQGMTDAPSICAEGLRVQTFFGRQPMSFDPVNEDKRQVYLWTEKAFEGDLHVSFDFKSLLPGGLSLLMFQASGMQREDFMADYKRRTDGAMKMVGWEDVRNYQWEYYREMNDCRNDVGSHYFKKNPYQTVLAYQCHPQMFGEGNWHRLQFLQEGDRLRGAIDGVTVFDCKDRPDIKSGPVYGFGRFAIRCMLRSHMIFRNLEVRTRPRFKAGEVLCGEPL
jgi:hypothetical protein